MSDAAEAASRIRLHESWKQRLLPELTGPVMQSLREFLRRELAAGKDIYPPPRQIFAALDHTPFDQVKVVILGQDPYHGPGQAQGLCFSVPPGVEVPPSLVNIYAELKRDLGIEPPGHGCLVPWADRGVLLLNAVLTVERGRAGSHQRRGWEAFTDRIVQLLNEGREGLVFFLWGAYAQAKGKLVDPHRHLLLRAPHPSPLSAHRGFIGCGHFSRANAWLKARGAQSIDWRLPPM
ncbi:MAG: uracil-DNA glycosylase [Xanthomonadales bacterium]|nr:Uracil-DNA glycosylase [Xanthomonadales bacterium]MCC6594545.1 uracil-DNA glycosylase [Xanthomonadales bacterium]MCE7931823.1 uracil-DNA glycosylase [Xanthomonadales bacterium PRO6]